LAAEKVDGVVNDVAFGDKEYIVEEEQMKTAQPCAQEGSKVRHGHKQKYKSIIDASW
jgi:hypothetical protein